MPDLPRLPSVMFLREQREELTQRGFKIDDRQLPGQPIGFTRLSGIRLFCPTDSGSVI
jgi:hypothetical protein